MALAVLVAPPPDVSADGWKTQLQGVKALGMGYAGRAVAEDAAVVWFNPAGMTDATQTWSFVLGAPLVRFALDFTDGGSRSVLGQPLAGPREAAGGQTRPVLHGYLVRRLSDRASLGLGVNFPSHGLTNDYGEAWVGRYHATASELIVLNVNPVVAVKVAGNVSIGLGLDVQRSSATLTNRIDFGSLGAAIGAPLTPQGHDGGIELRASDWAAGFDLSMAWQATPVVRVASTYRSQVEHTLAGTATFDVPAEAAFFTADGAFSPTRAVAVLPMPHELSAGVAWTVTPRWTIVGDLTWTRWSRFQQLVVRFDNPAQTVIAQPAGYRDSYRGAGGVILRATSRWTVRGGALYEDAPVPDTTRTPRLPEVDNVGVSAGASYRLSRRLDLDIGWSHLIPHDAPLDLPDPAAGQLTGHVRWKTDVFAIGISTRF